ncbi:MAG: NAD(P)-dependent oxidoreductase [Roseicyclus sp.]|uniref:NAD(P)-dependent oxidoreductase n=1 Tax=Boseongicola sp. H5 TaxID=2763261 RepID=UPI001B1E37B9|nr:NAD(P)-dependent oxidoreductase [Boseongicola sp. H5]MBO6604689.1 NAD(P)-dependent oxidoreductase [Roseicyclus sp.]
MKIGVVGLGLMGSALATHLIAAHPGRIVVWNRDPSKAEALRNKGAEVARTPQELSMLCDVIHLSLLDTRAVQAVAAAIFEVSKPGGLILDHSTISAEATRALSDQAAQLGWSWVDAPVSGGSEGARAGRLAVFLGGRKADMERASAACAPFARQSRRMGPSGAGQATKAANQLIVGGTFLLLAEAAVLAERAGVDAAILPEVLAGGFADSTLLQHQFARMVADDGVVQGTAAVMLKDLDLVADQAERSGTSTPFLAAAHAIWTAYVADGHGDTDWTAIAQRVRGKPLREGTCNE